MEMRIAYCLTNIHGDSERFLIYVLDAFNWFRAYYINYVAVSQEMALHKPI